MTEDETLKTEKDDRMTIVYCTDDKLFNQQLLSLISLKENTKEALNVINLTVEVKELTPKSKKTSKEQDEFCDKLLKEKNPNSSFRSIDVSDLFRKELLKGPNLHNKYYSYFVVVRLLMDLVPDIGDKALYIDSDVMFNGDVKELYDIDVTNYDYAGRKDWYRISKYLQSGVMLFNLKRVRENKMLERAREKVTTKRYFCYIDMTAVNESCKPKDKLRIDKKYNAYIYTDDCILFHVCTLREGHIPFTKKWWHRIKPQETELFVKRVPQMKKYVDEYLDYVEKYPDLFVEKRK